MGESSEAGSGGITFIVAKRPSREMSPLAFEQFVVDGIPVALNNQTGIPGDQGVWIEVGSFTVGKSIKVSWQFKTGAQVPSDAVRIAHCPNFNVQRAQTIQMTQLQPFTTYRGEFTATPESPFKVFAEDSREALIPGNPPRIGVAGVTGTYLIAFDNGVTVTLERVEHLTSVAGPGAPPIPIFKTHYKGGQTGTASFQVKSEKIIGIFLLKEDLNVT